MKKTPIAFALTLAFVAGCSMLPGQHGKPDMAQAAGQSMAKPSSEAVSQLIAGWPTEARHAAMKTMEKYGPPAEATPTQLVWFNNGPWKRTTIMKEEVSHDFPMPHKDVMEQVVDYKVPPDKADELAQFDGSVYVDRTRGEISARCDMEAANLLAINLAHDIITGKRSVEDAREFYPKAVMAHMMKQPTPYTEKLQFPAQQRTAFPDETTVSPQMVQKAKEMKEAMMKMDKEKMGGATGATRK